MQNRNIKHCIRLLIGFVLMAYSFFSCYDTQNSFGEDWVETAFRNVLVDTCTVSVTSSVIDSVETNGKGMSLFGKYTHSLWGSLSATSYLPYETPSYSTDADENVRLDSMVFAFHYTGYSIGDTTKPLKIRIHRLQERVLTNDNGYIYSQASFAYDPTPLATYTFVPNLDSDEQVEIRLSDEFGEELLSRLHNRDDGVSGDRFQDYFKGLAIVPDEETCQNAVSILVNDTSSVIILRYTLENDESEQECTITPNTTNNFYHIDHDRSATLLEGLPTRNVDIGSAELGNRGFLFGGLGWYSTLSFPHLNNILQLGERVAIESAYLKIYPEPGSWSEYNELPDSLYLYIVDENNVITDAVTDYLGEEVQRATFVEDNSIVGNNYYYFDITTFMQEELGAIGQYKHSLRLVLNDETYTQTWSNLTFGDQSSQYPINLQVTFKIYESY